MSSNPAWLSRTELLIGPDKLNHLTHSHVLIVGMGGVGSFAAEFICRAGVGQMTIVDGDIVDPTNRNRQLPALATNHGQPKADVMGQRLLAINPELKLTIVKEFIQPTMVQDLLAIRPNYMIDAIDSLTPKITFIEAAVKQDIPFVSSMGAGGKVDPTLIKVADISKTHACPLAHTVRKRLRKLHIYKGFKAVYSTEKVIEESLMLTDGTNFKKSAYGTISYLPAAFGGVCASVAIRHLIAD